MPDRGYEPVPNFTDNVGQILSVSSVLETLRRNAGVVDKLSYRPVNAFDSSATYDSDMTPTHYLAPPSDLRIWSGHVEWRTGTTTLTVQGIASGWGTESIYVHLDNNPTPAATIAPAASWSTNIAFSTGHNDGDVVYIAVWVKGAGRPSSAYYIVTDIYASPIVRSTTWGGVPTFTTVFDAAKLTQLANAASHLYNYAITAPHTARRTLRYVNGPFKNPAESGQAHHGNYPLWYGGIARNYTEDIMRVYGHVVNDSVTSLRLDIALNGSVVASSTFGVGTSTFSIPVSMSTVSVGSRAWVGLAAAVVTAGANRAAWKQTKWTIQSVRTEPSGSGYPYAALPAAFTRSDTPEQVRDKLNAIATILNNAATRMSSAAGAAVFNRRRAMRWWYQHGNGDNTEGVLHVRARPVLYRQGNQLTVRGRNVGIAWGAISVPTDDVRGTFDYDKHTFAKTASVIDADKTEKKTIYLDSIEGLFPGVNYELTGEVDLAYEDY